jgi:predicted dehydrogenase
MKKASRSSRRRFLKVSVAGAAGAGISSGLSTWSRVLGANDEIRIAVVGFRGKGRTHIGCFRKMSGVRVVALCDADRSVLERELRGFRKSKQKVDGYTDVRKLLEDKDIDAVCTATPNHWHALVTVWACQAGKDVYVEKPACHNIWEGRRMIEAARKYDRIVQLGTQSRSDRGLHSAFEFIRQGKVGKILWSRGFCYKRRGSIGKVSGPQKPPESVDYDVWCGPAPRGPLMRRSLHYDWHWVWDTGNGDIGNQGIHEMDMARWALGVEGIAPRVMSIGGRFGYDDDGETANTQVAFFDYKPAPLIFEVRGLPTKKGMKAMDHYRGTRIGVVVQCEGGYYVGGARGGEVRDTSGKRIKQFNSSGAGGHQANFIKAVRSRKVSDLNADILKGYLSSALCHMGNISHRVGRERRSEEVAAAIRGNKEMSDSFERFKSHLRANEVDLAKTRVVLGPMLEMDTEKERFVGEFSDRANALVSRDYRRPFVVPERV